MSWIVFGLLAGVAALPEESLDTIGLIEYWGYQGETYNTTTADGWTLQIHRIPEGKNTNLLTKVVNDLRPKPVIVLQHGLSCGSDAWVANTDLLSPGFWLADQGYDVWMLNSRGNEYTSHENLTADDEDFFKYTFDQMQQYDIPASFDLIENITGQESFYYVGHSQGTTLMFAKLAEDPDFGRRVRKCFAVGPAVSYGYMTSGLGAMCTLSNVYLEGKTLESEAYTQFGVSVLQPLFLETMFFTGCPMGVDLSVCEVWVMLGGPITKGINISRLGVYAARGHVTSFACLGHLCQLTDNFTKYSFPTGEENLEAYGSETPLLYPLENIRTPMYIFSSPDDLTTTELDLETNFFPKVNPDYVKKHVSVPGFGHMDYVFGDTTVENVFKVIHEVILFDF